MTCAHTLAVFKAVQNRLPEADVKTVDALLAMLDEKGFFLGENETQSEVLERLGVLIHALETWDESFDDQGFFHFGDEAVRARKSDQIADAVLQDAQSVIRTHYGFEIDWVPGFYPEKDIGLLWAGCTWIHPDYPYPIFVLRRAFQTSETFLKLYSRRELLAHELVHAARAPLESTEFEEHFAYAVSNSAFRRRFGNCFRTTFDALLFIVPEMLAIAVQTGCALFGTPLSHFGTAVLIFAAALPLGYLLVRNFASRRTVFRARDSLSAMGCSAPDAVLCRCTDAEIRALAKKDVSCVNADSLRMRMLRHRFFSSLNSGAC